MTGKRDVLIQIKTYKDIKRQLGYIKVYENKSFTELIEEWIEFYYSLRLMSLQENNKPFPKEEIRDLLEKYFDVKEMARGLLITEKTNS